MADISRIKIGGIVYNLNDAQARAMLAGFQTILDSKADAKNVYTRDEIIANYATKADLDDKVSSSAFTTYKETVTAALDGKMSKAEGLSKTDAAQLYISQSEWANKVDLSVYQAGVQTTNEALASKANSNDVYTKGLADDKFVEKTTLNNYVTSAYYEAGVQSINETLASKADSSNVYDKDTADNRFASKSDLNDKADTTYVDSAITGVQGEYNNKFTGVQGSLEILDRRLDSLEVDSETLETLKQIQAELADPSNEGGITSFLDSVKAAMNDGEVVDNNTTYTFEVGAQGTDNEGTLVIEEHTGQTTYSVWVPTKQGGGSDEPNPDPDEPTPDPEEPVEP